MFGSKGFFRKEGVKENSPLEGGAGKEAAKENTPLEGISGVGGVQSGVLFSVGAGIRKHARRI